MSEQTADLSRSQTTTPTTVGHLEGLAKVIVKAAAIVTTIVSVAVPVTEYFRGIANQKIAEAERKSKLASDYLALIAAKDTTSPDRIMYLSALATMTDHPLHDWAQQELSTQKKELQNLKAVLERAQKASEASSVEQAKVVTLENEINLVRTQQGQSKDQAELTKLADRLAGLEQNLNAARLALAEQKKEIVQAATAASLSNQGIDKSVQQLVSRGLPFNLSEFARSDTAQRLGVDNMPPKEAEEALKRIHDKIILPTRTHFGSPFLITNGYRSPEVDRALGGSGQSDHTRGEAVDFVLSGLKNETVACWIKDNLDFDELWIEQSWIHVSLKKEGNRKRSGVRDKGGATQQLSCG